MQVWLEHPDSLTPYFNTSFLLKVPFQISENKPPENPQMKAPYINTDKRQKAKGKHKYAENQNTSFSVYIYLLPALILTNTTMISNL